MKYLSRILLITFVFVFSATYSHADSWRDKTELLIYSPRYFGPNAFPIPEMRDGRVSERYEVEVRGEYHYYTGDKTWNIVRSLLLCTCTVVLFDTGVGRKTRSSQRVLVVQVVCNSAIEG